MKKLSKYTYLIENDNRFYIYNTATSRIFALHPDLYTLIKAKESDIVGIGNIHPDLYRALEASGIIVSAALDESEELITRYLYSDRDPSTFGIIVNPTLDCNLRCWYCYESHKTGSMMDETVMSSIKKLVSQKLSIPGFRHLSVSFFGGEPLIRWEKTVIPLLEYSVSECARSNISFNTGFTTNGVLLTEKKFRQLQELGLDGKASFQISFDGNKVFHDNSRVGINRRPTYDTIMKNVILGATLGFSMHLRFNYTPTTLESFVDILSEITSLPEETMKNIQCNFQQVWQTGGDAPEIKDRVLEIINQFAEYNVNIESDIRFSRHTCYADTENNIVVNHDGLVFKCTAREFSEENAEGQLMSDGTIIWNDRYYKRMQIKYANEACRHCRIMPICNGGCSQNKLDRNDSSSCAFMYDDQDKEMKMIASFFMILKNLAFSNKEIDDLLKQKKIRVGR